MATQNGMQGVLDAHARRIAQLEAKFVGSVHAQICALAELEKTKGADASKQAAAAAEIKELMPDMKVRIVGLKAKQELNGLTGTLISFDEHKGRWATMMQDGKKLEVKPDNLVVAAVGDSLAQLRGNHFSRLCARSSSPEVGGLCPPERGGSAH